MRPPIELREGDQLKPRELGPVAQTDIVRFAGAGGDFNPLHHDPAFAAAAGFDTVIAMGQMQAGMLASWVTDAVGVEHLRGFEVRFVAPVRAGDTLRFAGEVVSVADENGTPVAELALTAATEQGDAVKGRAWVQVS
ncbi:MAG: MaoC family dehydratase [Thermocrispum sp.]